jgi:glycosyltransferase involved in cell wall biosynthesis
MKRNPILCVSQQAEMLYKERFGSENTHVVYECPGVELSQILLDEAKTNIVMVGSINHRKGAELFSQVADRAGETHPDWQFHWIGALATMDFIYQSPNVTWHGWQWNPGPLVAQCDLFFLSSRDDPCPLSALEALAHGRRMVTFSGTGIAEIVDGTCGCQVFSDYDAESALASIEKALEQNFEPGSARALYQEYASVEAFRHRVVKATEG